jgi:ABC-2 type transport system ATP-binding protein
MPAQQIEAKWDVGFVSEDMRLYNRATLAWHMNFIQSIYPGWDPAYAEHLLHRFDLKSQQQIKGFSHGQQVKAMLLLVLARRPRLLVLDEPTTGLDAVARTEVLGELMEVLADEQRTIFFSSHNTQDIEKLSDQITFIDRGRIIYSTDKETFLDRWRRLRLEVPQNVDLPVLSQMVGLQKSGRQAVVTINGYEPEVASAYQAAGAIVQKVENMTLEEIFIANVEHSRKGRKHD